MREPSWERGHEPRPGLGDDLAALGHRALELSSPGGDAVGPEPDHEVLTGVDRSRPLDVELRRARTYH